ncbi:response regulator [Bdellovibrio sp. 22V]|uniref:response regulator n=1 Tax=Bdellovibrio TaxID=958 RepID=UPI002542AE35|nr:response regulator [Bdellovibrio sp. 22V]WII73841.1 response regulator [Bdellovibrio sp. 22V]
MSKILIVDDQKSVLLTLEALLAKEGHSVTACMNAIEASRTLGADTFDLVITDAVMPGGGDGYALTRAIRKQAQLEHLPVILLTGKREKSDVEKGIESGVSDYVIKPIDPELLMAKVRNLLPHNPEEKVYFVEAAVKYQAEWETKTEIVSVSEMGLMIQSNTPMAVGKITRLNSSLFGDIGIPKIPVRIDSCDVVPGLEPLYRMQAHFVGVTEKELAPLRLWIRSKKNY